VSAIGVLPGPSFPNPPPSGGRIPLCRGSFDLATGFGLGGLFFCSGKLVLFADFLYSNLFVLRLRFRTSPFPFSRRIYLILPSFIGFPKKTFFPFHWPSTKKFRVKVSPRLIRAHAFDHKWHLPFVSFPREGRFPLPEKLLDVFSSSTDYGGPL